MFTPSKLLTSMVLASWITLGVGLPTGAASTVSSASAPAAAAGADGDQIAAKKPGAKKGKKGKKKKGKKGKGKKKNKSTAAAQA